MEAFLQPLQGLAEFEEIKKRCGANRGILNVSGCMESQKVHLMYGLPGFFHECLPEKTEDLLPDKNIHFCHRSGNPHKFPLRYVHGNLQIRQRMRVIGKFCYGNKFLSIHHLRLLSCRIIKFFPQN